MDYIRIAPLRSRLRMSQIAASTDLQWIQQPLLLSQRRLLHGALRPQQAAERRGTGTARHGDGQGTASGGNWWGDHGKYKRTTTYMTLEECEVRHVFWNSKVFFGSPIWETHVFSCSGTVRRSVQVLQVVQVKAHTQKSVSKCHAFQVEDDSMFELHITGWWWSLWKNMSQLGWWFPIYRKSLSSHVPNHQRSAMVNLIYQYYNHWTIGILINNRGFSIENGPPDHWKWTMFNVFFNHFHMSYVPSFVIYTVYTYSAVVWSSRLVPSSFSRTAQRAVKNRLDFHRKMATSLE